MEEQLFNSDSSKNTSDEVCFSLSHDHPSDKSGTSENEADFKKETNIENLEKDEDVLNNHQVNNKIASQNESKIDTVLDDTEKSSISCYLCVKVNKNRDFIICPLNRKMKNRLKSEFWFQINDSR